MFTISTLEDIATLRESPDVECKLAQGRDGKGRLPHDIWETYSAFANTRGGDIFLGLEEYDHQRFRLMGIENTQKVLDEFWQIIRTPQKASRCIVSENDINVITIDNKNCIHIRIPIATPVQRPLFIGGNPFTGSYQRIDSSDIRLDHDTVQRMLAQSKTLSNTPSINSENKSLASHNIEVTFKERSETISYSNNENSINKLDHREENSTMNLSSTTLRYLDKALNQLRDLGLVPEMKSDEAPVISLLNQLTDLDETKVLAIARTLSQSSLFNEVVREQVSQMRIGERYEDITAAFDSIRKDAKNMVEQVEDDGELSTFEKISNMWMNATRGDISSRFDKIKTIYMEVARDSRDQIEREQIILNAYQDFRGAIKESEIYALDILQKAEAQWNQEKGKLEAAMSAVQNVLGDDLQTRAKLELARDETMRDLQDAESRFQVAKDISDNLTISYNTSEVVMTRLMQTTSAKERVYKQAVTFFGTNENVLTALSASFTGLFGLHESTQTLEAMKDGVSNSLEDLADIGGKVQEAAVKAGYGPTIRAESVKKLVDSVVDFQARSRTIINEMRTLSTKNAEEIRDAVEDGKQRLGIIIQQGGSLPLSNPIRVN